MGCSPASEKISASPHLVLTGAELPYHFHPHVVPISGPVSPLERIKHQARGLGYIWGGQRNKVPCHGIQDKLRWRVGAGMRGSCEISLGSMPRMVMGICLDPALLGPTHTHGSSGTGQQVVGP